MFFNEQGMLNLDEAVMNQPTFKKIMEDDIEFANDMTGCATAVNTLTCLLTAGGSSLVWWVTEFGIAYVHDKTVKKAWEDYEKCIERCKS